MAEILTVEQVKTMRDVAAESPMTSSEQSLVSLCDSHEALRLALTAAQEGRDSFAALADNVAADLATMTQRCARQALTIHQRQESWRAMKATLDQAVGRAETLRQDLDATVKQLPDGMKHCTIVFEECPIGHGRLRGTNWIDNGCLVCRAEQAEQTVVRVRAFRDVLCRLPISSDERPVVTFMVERIDAVLAPPADAPQETP